MRKPSLRRRLRSHTSPRTSELEPICLLWILRILIPLGGHHNFIDQRGFRNDNLAEAIGFGHWVDPYPEDFDPKLVLSEARALHKEVESGCARAKVPDCLEANVRHLAEQVGLDEIDSAILRFAVMLHSESLLDDAADWLGQMNTLKVHHVLAVVLDLPESAVRAALSTHGLLARSGLVTIDHQRNCNLRSKLDLLSHEFADLMLSTRADLVDLLRGTLFSAGPAHLRLDDFAHLERELRILHPYLRKATASKRPGVNLFLHGAPGTGKSQLARVLAEDLGYELYEIAREDDDGDPVQGERRLRAFRAAQSFFAKRKALIVFDEVEDIFNDGFAFLGRKSTAQNCKPWLNQMLEENPVPTLWLSNSIQDMDPAFIRRFDMVIELPVPPRQQRERILREHCADLLDDASLARIAEVEDLAPALVTKASSVIRSISDELGPKASAEALEQLISATLEAQGHRPLITNDPNRLPEVYDPGFIAADADLSDIANGLIEVKSGRICLYGPPGTGKTAYGRWLAEQLELPLIIKRASDLISKWVGGSEKNIARAFREADQQKALLLIDEVDSFLQDRRGARHSWEVSSVNEMLTQMEAFPGVFIATTNLMRGLDQAALRRFDLKVKLGYLKPQQAWELACRHCQALGLSEPSASDRAQLATLKQLTPGDFMAVLRQHRFRPLKSPKALIAALAEECAVKEGPKRSIGFI